MDKARMTIDEAVIASESLGPFNEKKIIYTVAGDIYSVSGEHDTAAKLYEKALLMGATYGEDDADLMLSLGHEYLSQKLYVKATEKYNDSLELSKRIDHHGLQARSYANLGATFALQGKKEEALSYFTTARNLFADSNNEDMVARMNSSIAHYELL